MSAAPLPVNRLSRSHPLAACNNPHPKGQPMILSARSRALLAAAAISLALAGCTTTSGPSSRGAPALDPQRAMAQATYAERTDEKFPVPAVDVMQMETRNIRRQVAYPTPHAPGTVIVDTKNRFIYLVQEDGKAMRYGVGVGQQGLAFKGNADIGLKREWPNWAPTPNMIARQPERYGPVAGGVKGGPENPLGARALYLYRNGKDTLFRIHGTNEPETIGQAMSSGCIRMMNQDVIDLYNRVPAGSKVVVL